jgi:hypothetical protein
MSDKTKVLKEAPFNGKTVEQYWTDKAKNLLVGRKIVKVRYLSPKETEESFGWHNRTIVMTLDNGCEIIPQMDDEGNDAGVILWSDPYKWVTHPMFPNEKFNKSEVIPVIS